MKDKICILGSTGSIGCSTLDVIERNPDQYEVEVLTANTNAEKLAEQCKKFNPKLAVLKDENAAEELSKLLSNLGCDTKVECGEQALVNAAKFPGVATVVAAIVGAAGLMPTLAAVESGHKVLLANKEALVMSGELFINAVEKHQAVLLPVDSEHNAIFQCLPGANRQGRPEMNGVRKILLTGSGGPFRTIPISQLSEVTPDQACAHPNWDMGRKISVDSATMMNKGLELIEACYFFGVELEQIDIVVHPQSIVHSMVSYIDGSVLAQMGNPDMRTPIAHTLAWPERVNAGVEPLDFYTMSNLTFEPPDFERFPCLKLASEAMLAGGTSPCILNAANETAVAAFLDGKIAFTDIAKVIEMTLSNTTLVTADSLEKVLAADGEARRVAIDIIEKGVIV
ncbi:1-deoxy-D-xylulose-5-phosphate reductoisomerase [Aliikangiella coralliicola]|uniref:1-deoxy-D-xylulose 5-phosphate reductoisomerase n=1 Tax=Aliikangiella coralliicola TaxID=2592383 RepID=A0A545UAZ8_9GAMM|nr:1-deoxy-D-xylulose-5-phosphate reductoisomerase [Aliikangiella coralliicola]TQV86639.1 1-deoxy-D-xylulose-5-phosphate reductoisomerase [Aliikangiella coralliicola]